MVMTLSRSGNGWSDGLHRSYDVWGSLRWNPSSSADVKQRYCANLGHVEDDQSGLIYMRARFHEPWTGRFINQDPAMHGWNWYVYSNNSPVNFSDFTGKETCDFAKLFISIGFLASFISASCATGGDMTSALLFATIAVSMFALAFAVEERFGDGSVLGNPVQLMAKLMTGIGGVGYWILSKFMSNAPTWLKGFLGSATAGAEVGGKSHAALAVNACIAYSYLLAGAMLGLELAGADGL